MRNKKITLTIIICLFFQICFCQFNNYPFEFDEGFLIDLQQKIRGYVEMEVRNFRKNPNLEIVGATGGELFPYTKEYYDNNKCIYTFKWYYYTSIEHKQYKVYVAITFNIYKNSSGRADYEINVSSDPYIGKIYAYPSIEYVMANWVIRGLYDYIKPKTDEELNIKNQNNTQNTNTKIKAEEPEIKKNEVISEIDEVDFIGCGDNNATYGNFYALVIGNENYLEETANVDFANNDADIFAKYCTNRLCVPEDNIFLYKDLGAVMFHDNIRKFIAKMKRTADETSIIYIYYAGHGIPNPSNNNPYLLPTDLNESNIKFGIEVKALKEQLAEINAEKVFLILDACFTGANARSDGMLASSRSIKIAYKKNLINKGRVITISATKGTMPAKAMIDQKHGVFTYYFLKQMKENSKCTLEEMMNYLKLNVNNYVYENYGFEQSPTLDWSPVFNNDWQEIVFY